MGGIAKFTSKRSLIGNFKANAVCPSDRRLLGSGGAEVRGSAGGSWAQGRKGALLSMGVLVRGS
jgi:hypothetical protein